MSRPYLSNIIINLDKPRKFSYLLGDHTQKRANDYNLLMEVKSKTIIAAHTM